MTPEELRRLRGRAIPSQLPMPIRRPWGCWRTTPEAQMHPSRPPRSHHFSILEALAQVRIDLRQHQAPVPANLTNILKTNSATFLRQVARVVTRYPESLPGPSVSPHPS